jgi:hypothetical protein
MPSFDFRTTCLATIVLLAVTIPCRAQNAAGIVIRFLNGKNGKPVKDKQVTIIYGKGPAVYLDADSKGEIVLSVADVEGGELRVRPDYYFDCRFTQDQAGPGGLEVKYSGDEIISNGIVGENLCSKAHSQPSPGVLILYLRPRSFLEKWKL